MKDGYGVYYYPFPDNRRVRMYVKSEQDSIFFRLWSADDPDLWTEHGWVPYEAVKKAIRLYSGRRFNPSQAYDPVIARAVLREAEKGG
jgi:hypothetical protein